MAKPALVLFLGSVRKGEYEALLAGGYRLGIILDDNRQATAPAGFELALRHDFSRPLADVDPVIAAVSAEFQVIAVLNLREFYVQAQAYVARRLALPGLPETAVERVLNKTLMRQALVEALGPACTPRFKELSTLEDALDFADAVGFPVILKPNNLYGSLFVRTAYNAAELTREFAAIQRQIQAHAEALGVVQFLEKTIQIEEYLTGAVHSIDCLVDGAGRAYPTPVVDVLTGHDIGQPHFGHVIRKADSHLSPSLQQEMTRLATTAVGALNIRNAVAHVEFIAAPAGPKLLEIAARPGGHRHRVLEMTYGVALNEQYLRLLLGHEPELRPKRMTPFLIFTPYPTKEISFQGIDNLDQVMQLASYQGHEYKVKPGARIGPAREGFMSSWVVELSHPDRAVLHNDMAWLSRNTFFEESSCVS